ncbi:helix-turn-helix domain-containing protein [Ramlibacter sp. PS3R-8]|uniref:helix-turn-helix domain-containing protein n=1 Tax=Ramlibacter sp. PS3R-8 TaxID=3133437 RepID=UPI0030A28A49
MSDKLTPDLRVLLGTQLVDQLKSLRKLRGLTQAELGQLLGLSQARVAVMEARPGSLTLDQLLRLLNALGADMLIRARPLKEEAGVSKTKRFSPVSDKAHRHIENGRSGETLRQPREPTRATEGVRRNSSLKTAPSVKPPPNKVTSFTMKLPKNKGSW